MQQYVRVAEGKSRTCSNDIRDAHDECEIKTPPEGSCNEQLLVDSNQKSTG